MVNSHIFFFNVISLSSFLWSYSKIQISKLITNPRSKYSEDSSDQTKKYVIVSKVVSFFYSNPKNSSYFIHNIIHRSSIQHWMKKDEMPIFPINGSNLFINMSVLYRKKKNLFWNHLCINIVVERVPCCVWTSNGLVLTMLTIPHYWFIESQSRFTNESRNAMVLAYNF